MAITVAADKETGAVKKTKWYRQLYFWVIVAIVLGVLVGWLWPGFGTRWNRSARRSSRRCGC